MISKTIGFRDTLFSDTPIEESWKSGKILDHFGTSGKILFPSQLSEQFWPKESTEPTQSPHTSHHPGAEIIEDLFDLSIGNYTSCCTNGLFTFKLPNHYNRYTIMVIIPIIMVIIPYYNGNYTYYNGNYAYYNGNYTILYNNQTTIIMVWHACSHSV